MRVLVVGYGNMGRNHARTLEALGHTPVTVDPRKAQGAAHSKVGRGHRCTAAIIAAPPAELATEAAYTLSLGLPTLVEKPGATTLADAVALANHPNAHLLRVGYVERHNPAVRAIHRNLHHIGDLLHLTAQRLGPAPGRSLTTPLLDLASHDLDVIRTITGYTPARVKVDRIDDRHTVAVCHLTRRSKPTITATLEASYIHPVKTRTLTAVGEDGMLSLDYQAQTLTHTTADHATQVTVLKAAPLTQQAATFLAFAQHGQGNRTMARIDDAIAILAAFAKPEVIA